MRIIGIQTQFYTYKYCKIETHHLDSIAHLFLSIKVLNFYLYWCNNARRSWDTKEEWAEPRENEQFVHLIVAYQWMNSHQLKQKAISETDKQCSFYIQKFQLACVGCNSMVMNNKWKNYKMEQFQEIAHSYI